MSALALAAPALAAPAPLAQPALAAPALAAPALLAPGWEQRIEAERAIQEVYWHHRIWPAQNPGPKPALSAVLDETALAARVDRALRQSAALERYWADAVTGERLQAEMDRMARDTRRPAVLRELFAALDDDPARVAESLARPILAERLLRNHWAGDPRFGDDAASGEREAPTAPASDSGNGTERPAPGRASSFEAWWSATAPGIEPIVRAPDFDYTLPDLSAAVDGCAVDTWTPGPGAEVPDSRTDHAAVWTGSELMVWGGFRNGAGETDSGAIYDPATDTWRPTADTGAPSPRTGVSGVWTGTTMIVWGGQDGGTFGDTFNDGGIYDPTGSGSWTPLPVAGAPTARHGHTAVWTGTKMIVWGGTRGQPTPQFAATGGVFDPAGGGSWSPTSQNLAPSARGKHTAVWSGSEMIVWGGAGATGPLGNGGRYDPTGAGSWIPIQAAGGPSPRASHTAVWTGSTMIVWGGDDDNEFAPTATNTGGIFEPAGLGNWTPTPTLGAPGARSEHTAVWTGSEMIVWGGGIDGSNTNTGGSFDPSTSSWTPTPTAGAPSIRAEHTAVWTGTRMIVWGGTTGSYDDSGALYDPASGFWIAMPTSPASPFVKRSNNSMIWTGSEVIVWGGATASGASFSGGRYDPATGSWSNTSQVAAPTARTAHTAVWTGTEMIVWGGRDFVFDELDSGGHYDPANDTWTPTALSGAPVRRTGHTAVWTGSRMVVWGGYDGSGHVASGGVYDPAAGGSWTPTALGGAPTGRSGHRAVWTGSRMLVWGGFGTATGYLDTGGVYDPAGAGTWTPMTGTGAPTARARHTAVWTGDRLIVWGGSTDSARFDTGGLYDPVADDWAATSTVGAPEPRDGHAVAWTGDEMIVWGGFDGSESLRTGGRYDPAGAGTWTATPTLDAPLVRRSARATFDGTEMLVAAGLPVTNSYGSYCACATGFTWFQDADLDGFGNPGTRLDSCSATAPPGFVADGGDCDDGNPDAWRAPGEAEALRFTDATSLAWDPPADAGGLPANLLYDVLRADDPADFVGATTCVASDTTATTATDGTVPATGAFFSYLARAANACPSGEGPLGSASDGTPRTGRACP